MATGSPFGKGAGLDRKQFWIWVGALLAVKIALVVGWDAYPAMINSTKSLETVLMVFVAMTIGARFKDIGWNRWMGIAIAVVIVFVLPLVLLFGVALPSGQMANAAPDASPLDILPWYVGWSSTACLLVLVVIAGVQPSKIDAGPAQAPGRAHP
jgi:hydrogenase-4 membrane subunit HyfE